MTEQEISITITAGCITWLLVSGFGLMLIGEKCKTSINSTWLETTTGKFSSINNSEDLTIVGKVFFLMLMAIWKLVFIPWLILRYVRIGVARLLFKDKQ